MSEDTPYIPPGAEDEEQSDVLGKLDHLLNKHKPRPRDSGSGALPVLTEALPPEPAEAIPTLTDIVAPGAKPQRAPDTGHIETALIQRLAIRLEVERSRLLADGASADRAAVLDELVARLRASLPDIVRVALDREERR
jgi:hypothetical protein